MTKLEYKCIIASLRETCEESEKTRKRNAELRFEDDLQMAIKLLQRHGQVRQSIDFLTLTKDDVITTFTITLQK